METYHSSVGAVSSTTDFFTQRQEMVDQLLIYANLLRAKVGNHLISQQVLDVLRVTPRHRFVPPSLRSVAYADSPLPIGHGKTISQPFIVALMTSLLDIRSTDRVLEVGTGAGYQTAVLSNLAKEVFSIEILEALARDAEKNLSELQVENARLGIGDGSGGWSDNAPYDKILVSAAPELIPVDLLTQLKPGGKMVIPAGLAHAQQLLLVEKDPAGRLRTQEILDVEFSAMTYT